MQWFSTDNQNNSNDAPSLVMINLVMWESLHSLNLCAWFMISLSLFFFLFFFGGGGLGEETYNFRRLNVNVNNFVGSYFTIL